ncbi:MAG: bifunctional UDP-N-acetylglucosamine diphosphorylase/glucosamine-1-phosphate N-acetyltransferase GlmU [Blastocatellia bacterium]|nr:bifunctional UDP-N-acetylglucosamine diphosphorylase/glucosamine-1-phosphate N-acetyltransferase GlmU [Blastocatellia bacterium]MCS7156232.1 bifunctional UDP-N-acetylglucosamine diphosphorylase/glucosamine-1-phosphate N-acetyltransferase GlmU [Blastocatellia bacterium]MCX7751418.1 bifunctional UDP-N-acetylglucosamine diphosphorylase/glucosamine-1-phosphate N-acetyltransferase GlmU [Blastocatellia bacterium]MDW8169131.1 bifunctional UDP-N-acetylglucosamine diphosphorylase/glucosamine-1-phospha
MRPNVVILAAGLGTRMRSRRAKVLHELAGRPLIAHVVRAALGAHPSRLIVVIGHQAEDVRRIVEREVARNAGEPSPRLLFALQHEPLGTGHAALMALETLGAEEGPPHAPTAVAESEALEQWEKWEEAPVWREPLVLLYGDMPRVRSETIARLVAAHLEGRAVATLMTLRLEDPTGYGRIVRDAQGEVVRIVEETEARPEERAIQEVNAGLYCFDPKPLLGALRRLRPENRKGEYYLTDVVGVLTSIGYRVRAIESEHPEELLGVNTREDLARLEAELRREICARWMREGVTIRDPNTTWIDADVVIGADTVLHPYVHLEGETRLGEACEVHAWTRIVDSQLGDRVIVRNFTVIQGSRIGNDVRIGPFAHLRGEVELADEVAIGNFVEVKKSRIGRRSKAMHLAYLGDATVGERVNVGAGTITCNYDGKRKHPTIIEDDVKLGSDTMLVAPVRVGRGAMTGAGAVVIRDVPERTLVVGVPAVEKKKVEEESAPEPSASLPAD